MTSALEQQLADEGIFARSSTLAPEPLVVSMTAEQKEMLEKPVDPKVEHLLEELRATKAEAEREADRIIPFPRKRAHKADDDRLSGAL